MAGTNQFLPFATGAGANALTVPQYQALTARQGGFVAGLAKSIEVNTAIRQSSSVSAMIGQFIADLSGEDANDDGNIAVLERRFRDALLQSFISDAGASLVHYGRDTSSVANLLDVPEVVPSVSQLTEGLFVLVKVANRNTAATSIRLNGLQTKPFVRRDGSPLQMADLLAGDIVAAVYDGTQFKLIGPGRAEVVTVLTSAIIFYVRTDGDDNNDGFLNTPSRAKKTIQSAVDAIIKQYSTTGFKATIYVADGTYGPVLLLRSGATNIEIIGNTGAPGNVVIAGGTQDAVAVSTGSSLSISGVKLTSNAGSGLLAFDRSAIRFSLIDFGACQFSYIYANTAAGIFADGNFTISGSSQNALLAGTGSNVSTTGRTVAFVGSPSAAIFARANNGTILAAGMTFTGTYGSGQRYLIEVGGTIYTAGAGVNYFPGTTAGTVVNGVYI